MASAAKIAPGRFLEAFAVGRNLRLATPPALNAGHAARYGSRFAAPSPEGLHNWLLLPR